MINRHLEEEFYTCCPVFPENCGTIRMKVKSERGQTQWFTITPEQFSDIEKVLVYGHKVITPEN